MPLYEVAVIARNADGDEWLALVPTPVIAADEKAAIMVASLKSASGLAGMDHGDVTVIVRPFKAA